jgi:hypothetical protein
MVVRTQQQDFAEFYSSAADKCLRTVWVSIGDQDTAQELVEEAFARAWSSWRTVSRHPSPKAWVVRTALNAGISRWRRRRREVSYRLTTWRLSRSGGDIVMTLHPSQLPSGAGMSFSVAKLEGLPFGVKIGLVHIGLVKASQQCTVSPGNLTVCKTGSPPCWPVGALTGAQAAIGMLAETGHLRDRP